MSVTPSQTVGPYFRIGLIHDSWPAALAPVAVADISIAGTMLDSEDRPITDGMIEVWSAEPRYFTRVETHPDTGGFHFRAPLPRAARQPGTAASAPHLTLGVYARGLLKQLHTRIYFADEPLNLTDPILALVPAERRATLIAVPIDEGRSQFRFDLRLAGKGETVFFEC
jgi:protocatechuate 3,4-dioxygenase alpha subunit